MGGNVLGRICEGIEQCNEEGSELGKSAAVISPLRYDFLAMI